MTHFKVQVRTRGTPATSHGGDVFSLPDNLTRGNEVAMVMGIDGHHACFVPQNDNPPIASWTPITKDNFPICRCTDQRSLRCRNINAIMPLPAMHLKSPSNRPLQGPEKA